MKTSRNLLFLLSILAAQTIPAAQIVVTSSADTGPNTLRAALTSAADEDVIKFSLRPAATILLSGGELVVNRNVAIIGPGADNLAINGNAASRVFHIMRGKRVNIGGLAIVNGLASGAGYPDNAGGGI